MTKVGGRTHYVQSRKRPRLSEDVVSNVGFQIISGHIPPGSKLPTEPELCEAYGVSRTVVRDAVAHLRSQGLVQVRQGIGTVVLDHTRWNDFDPDLLRLRLSTGFIGDIVRDLLEIRRLVEVETAGNAALRRTYDDLRHLAELEAEMTANIHDAVAFTDCDLQFHDALMTATGNLLLRKIMQSVNQLRRVGSILTTSSDPQKMTNSMQGHRAILAAVEAGDPIAAKTAMAEHLMQFEQDISEAITNSDPQKLRTVTESPTRL